MLEDHRPARKENWRYWMRGELGFGIGYATSGAVGPGLGTAFGRVFPNLLRLPRVPKSHARIPEPCLRHRYARFSDMLIFVWIMASWCRRDPYPLPILSEAGQWPLLALESLRFNRTLQTLR